MVNSLSYRPVCVLTWLVGIWLFFGVTHTVHGQLRQYISDKKVVHLPFTYASNFIIIQTKVGGVAMDFIFDTGAEHTLLLKRSYFSLLGLPLDRRVKIFGSDLKNHRYAYIARKVPLQVQGADLIFEDILVMDEDYTILDEISGRSIDGILGASMFKNYVVKIDYRRQRLTLYQADAFKQPSKKYTPYPIQLHQSKPYLEVTSHFTAVDSAELMLLLDTGAGIGLILHSNSNENITVPDNYIASQLGMGLGGQVLGYMGRVDQLRFKDVVLNGVITGFQEVDRFKLKDADFIRNGIMGNQILSRFTVIVDYPNQQLYLKPNSSVKRSFDYDRSGILLMASGVDKNEFNVIHTLPNSPAADAGIQVHDQLIRVNGRRTEYMSLEAISKILRRKSGKKVRIQVKRDEELLDMVVVLRDLI